MNAASSTHFDRQYQTHLKHLKLKGLQPKTIEAYAHAIRRLGDYFDRQFAELTETQLTEYFKRLRVRARPTNGSDRGCAGSNLSR